MSRSVRKTRRIKSLHWRKKSLSYQEATGEFKDHGESRKNSG